MTTSTFTTGSDSVFSLDKMMEAIRTFEPRPPQTLLVSPGMKHEMAKAAFALEPRITDPPWHVVSRQTFMGLPVRTLDIPPEEVLDWSDCRSPSRAKRRHARGIPQRVKITYRERAYMITDQALADFNRRFEQMAMKALFGDAG